MTDPWVQTYTLRAFDLLEPTPEMVDTEDIAHALSRLNRFSGHTHGEMVSAGRVLLVTHASSVVAECDAALVVEGGAMRLANIEEVVS